MAFSSISFLSNKERTNYSRLCRAIVDLCTEVLRDVLKSIATPAGLRTKISACDELKSRSHKLDAGQWKIASTVFSLNSYREFDITLLYKLIRAFSVQEMRDELSTFIQPSQILLAVQGCLGLQPLLNQVQMKTIQYSSSNGSYSECDCFLLSLLIQHLHSSYKPKILPSSKRWGDNSVLNTNVTYGDDIERIRIMRNRVYGHVSDTLVTDGEFNDHWAELGGIMVRMDARLVRDRKYKDELDVIQNACMDDHLERAFMSEIQRSFFHEKNLRTEVEEIKSIVANLRSDVESHVKGKNENTEEKTEATIEDLHYGLIAKLMERIHPKWKMYPALLVKLQGKLGPVYIADAEESVKSLFDALERKGELDIGKYPYLRQALEGLDEIAVKLIDECQRKLDKFLKLAEIQSLKSLDEKSMKDEMKELRVHVEKVESQIEDLKGNIENALEKRQRMSDNTEIQRSVDEKSIKDEMKELRIHVEKNLKEMGSKIEDLKGQIEKTEGKRRRMSDNTEIQSLRSVDEKSIKDEMKELRIHVDKNLNEMGSKIADLSGKIEKILEKRWRVSDNTEIFYDMRQKDNLVPEHIRARMRIRMDEWKSATYVEVKASKTVSISANTNTVVTVTSNPGMGKSAIIHHIALELASKGFDILPVDSVTEMDKYLNPDCKQVFVLDNPIGDHSLDVDELEKWVKFNPTLACLSVSNTKILCSIRKAIVSEFNFKVKDTVLNKNIIDLQDPQNLLKEDEKLKILEQHLIGKQYEISNEMKTGISKITDYFPLICKLFASDGKFRKLGLKFFQEPFTIIKDELDGMFCEDKFSYCVLVLCFLENNSLPFDLFDPCLISKSQRNLVEKVSECCGLSRCSPLSSLRKKLKTLETVFLQRVGNNYRFVHEVINDVVAYHSASNFPSLVIQQSSSKFISETFVVSRDHVSTNTDEKNVILLDEQYFPVLLERLLDDIRQGRYYHVFSNKCWDHTIFVDSISEMYSESREKKRKYQHKEDVIEVFCSSVEKCDKNDELRRMDTVDQWTWYYFAMSHLLVEGISVLHWVVTFAHKYLFEYIWSEISPDQKKNIVDKVPLIHFACMGGNVDICRKVLELESNKINTPLKSNTDVLLPLHCAAISSLHVIDLLVDQGAEINAKSPVTGRTPILYAAAHGINDTVLRLISHDADINIPDSENASPVWFTCQNGHKESCELLINRDANVNIRRNDGSSPLLISCQKNNINIVQLLLKHGADVNMHTELGSTPLIAACLEQNAECTKLLLDTDKCLLDHLDMCCYTALMHAAESNDTKSTELLIKRGCDIKIRNNDDKTALDLAKEKNNHDAVQILKNATSDKSFPV